jgi:hypothetical protein
MKLHLHFYLEINDFELTATFCSLVVRHLSIENVRVIQMKSFCGTSNELGQSNRLHFHRPHNKLRWL